MTGPRLEPEDLVPLAVEVSRENAEASGLGGIKGDKFLVPLVVLDGIQRIVEIKNTKGTRRQGIDK